MTFLIESIILLAGTISDLLHSFLSSHGGIVTAMAVGVSADGGLTEAMLAHVRNWHLSIEKKFSNVKTLYGLIADHQPVGPVPDDLGSTDPAPGSASTRALIWPIDAALYAQLRGYVVKLEELIEKCKSPAASAFDRADRNSLLKTTVTFCLVQMKAWAYGLFAIGTITTDDLHKLGFLAPGEKGGSHERTEATRALAEVKVSVLNEDSIHVVIDQSSDQNAGPVIHGWPQGVKQALIVVLDADGTTEVVHQLTTHLHNTIRMPEGSHGKLFIIKAAFLKHIDDAPLFGNEPTFSMPLTTADLASGKEELARQKEELEHDKEELARQKEELTREIEQLRTRQTGK